jgi:NTE family protein
MKKLLILSGGGAKGAFQAGVIYNLVRSGKLKDDEIFAVAGTSVGSINGLWCASNAALTPRGTELMKDMWLSLKPRNVYKQQPKWFAFLKALILKRNYIFDFSPLEKYLHEKIVPLLKFNKIYINCSVNLQTGKSSGIYVEEDKMFFGDSEVASDREEMLVKSVLASCAIPVVFPPVKIGKYSYVDGGVREVIPVGFAISNLRKHGHIKGGDEINVIIVSCSPLHTLKEEEKNFYENLYAILARSYDILWQEHLKNDVRQISLYNLIYKNNNDTKSEIVKLNVEMYTPVKKLGDATDFTPTTLRKYFEMGERGNFIKYVSYR